MLLLLVALGSHRSQVIVHREIGFFIQSQEAPDLHVAFDNIVVKPAE